MATIIKHKRSNTPGAVPEVEDLAEGEIAINTADGKLFITKGANEEKEVVTIISDAVSYKSQSLSSGQKAQARANIDAPGVADLAATNDDTKGAALVGFTNDRTDSVPRNVQFIIKKYLPIHVEEFGDLGTADDIDAFTKAIAAAQAQGGGEIIVPVGEFIVGISSGVVALSLLNTTNVYLVGRGRGASRLKLKDGSNGHLIAVDGAVGGAIVGLSLDGNRANQAAGHCLRFATVTDFFVEDFHILNAYRYGIGAQTGTATNLKIRSGLIEDTGGDGIDWKNVNDNNDDCLIDDVTVKNPGRDGSLSNQAGIDIRGPVRVINSFVSGFQDAGATTGIRCREGENIDVNGFGGHFARLVNNTLKAGGTAAGSRCIDIAARNVTVDGGLTIGGNIGVLMRQREIIIKGIQVHNASDAGIKTLSSTGLTSNADYCVVSGVIARGCDGAGIEINTNECAVTGSVSRGNATGILLTANSANNAVVGNTTSSNSTADITDNGTENTIENNK